MDKRKGRTTKLAAEASPGFPFVKFLIFAALIAGFLYGPNFFNKKGATSAVVPALDKAFALKRVAQFSGEDLQKGAIFANDIVAVGPHSFALTDNLNAQVLVCDFNGKLLHKWGKNGSEAGEFHEPSSLATDGKGKIFVLDTLNGYIKVFDLKGKHLASKGLAGQNYFVAPRRLGWDGSNLLVSNSGDARIARLTLKGELLPTWGEKGPGLGGLWGSCKAVVDTQGNYYIGESANDKSRVLVYDKTGRSLKAFGTGVPADSLGLDREGRIYVVSYGRPAKVLSPEGKDLGVLVDAEHPSEPLKLLAGIEVLPDGLILTCGGDIVTLFERAVPEEKK